MNEPKQVPSEQIAVAEEPISPAELRARRSLILGMVVAVLLLLGMTVLLVFLALDAYRVAPEPSPGAVVVSLLRDAAIVLVAFETMLIGVLMIVLILQVQACLLYTSPSPRDS